jgi:HEAT repeat protein
MNAAAAMKPVTRSPFELIFVLSVVWVAMASVPILRAAEADEETALIQVLQRPDASPQELGAACDRLQRIGTARSVPHLVKRLNGDPQLAQSTRQTLETMADPAAGEALVEALATTQGLNQAGVATSLGVRRESRAVPALAALLGNSDTNVAIAGAAALGKIGGKEALGALQSALAGAKEPVRSAIVDGVLACGYHLLAEGDAIAATAVFQPLTDPKEKDFIRIAAFRGLIQSAGSGALKRTAEALTGKDGAAQVAALQLARELPGQDTTRGLAALLKGAPPTIQVALLEALNQRRDPAAASAILPLVTSPEPSVQVAAVTALGHLGNATTVPPLLTAAASKDASVQKAAREALLTLRGATESLLVQVSSPQPDLQAEAIRALSGRAEPSAAPRLLELARVGEEATRIASLRALATLADEPQVAVPIQVLLSADSAPLRNEAQRTVAAIYQRALASGRPPDCAPIVKALADRGANPEGRAALLQVCSLFVDPQVRSTLRAALKDSPARVRDAAIRAVCDSRDPEFLPDLLALARETQETNYRALAIRGYVRLVTEENGARAAGKPAVELLKPVLELATRVEDKRVVLAGLATVPDLEALKLVQPMLTEAAVKEEAAQAVLQIAAATAAAHPQETKTALNRVIEATSSVEARNQAVALARQIDQMADFIIAWQMAGPYRENGKDYAALFDIVFPPETAGAKDVTWKPLPAGTDPARPYVLDLLKALGGEQCVAYARTSVFAEKEQPAVLELGSDDGAKVWLNSKLVHANNTARPITPGSDKIAVTLRAGWNPILLKITQNNQGWEFSVRFVRPDGSRLEGLRVEPGRSE